MRAFFDVTSYRDVARVSGVIVFASVLLSLLVGNAVARALDLPLDWRHYLFGIGMPLFLTPLAVVPLVVMNLRLSILRTELHTLARTDVLTGLMNRRAFFEHGSRSLAAGSANVAVMMIDVDRFKAFNDTHGHDAGDAVLRMIAATISSTVSLADTAGEAHLARIGGEEFALIVTRIPSEYAEQLADAICARVRATSCMHRGIELRATISVGVAPGTGAEKIQQLLKAADTAVYEAKRSGRDRWCVATPVSAATGKGMSTELRAHPRAA